MFESLKLEGFIRRSFKTEVHNPLGLRLDGRTTWCSSTDYKIMVINEIISDFITSAKLQQVDTHLWSVIISSYCGHKIET